MTPSSILTPDLLHELREFDTALLANTIGFIDPTPAHEFYLSGEVQSVTPTLGPTIGVAFTCEIDSSTPGNTGETDLYWQQLERMAQSKLPVIWVVKAVGSRPEHECVIGDGMAKTLHAVGCVGLVTDGRVRDVAGLLTTPFAAYCRGKAIHHVPMHFRSVDHPVEVGGLTIYPGDLLHANAEGVIRIPPSCAAQLPAAAVRMRAFEHDLHKDLRRTDRSPMEKLAEVKKLIAQYGFADCVAGGKR
jgi:regulator of RNase E activity RraA